MLLFDGSSSANCWVAKTVWPAMEVGDSSSQMPWEFTADNGRDAQALAVYTRYARLLPDYVPVPCEVDPWDTPPPEVEELVGSAAS